MPAYKYRSTMLVTGTVSYVSADRLTDEVNHQPYYAAHIRLEPAALKEVGDLHPTAGMPAEVFIRTGTRSLFDYFIEPLTSSLRRGMRES